MCRRSIVFILAWLLCSCVSEQNRSSSHDPLTEARDLVTYGKYQYSASKLNIPRIVLDSLERVDDRPFTIADNTERDRVDLSCIVIQNDSVVRYNKLLHFVVVSDTSCLLAYTGGGLGVHDVVDYLNTEKPSDIFDITAIMN